MIIQITIRTHSPPVGCPLTSNQAVAIQSPAIAIPLPIMSTATALFPSFLVVLAIAAQGRPRALTSLVKLAQSVLYDLGNVVVVAIVLIHIVHPFFICLVYCERRS